MPRPGKTAMLRLEPLHRMALRLDGSAPQRLGVVAMRQAPYIGRL